MGSVDNRVVRMEFDNAEFERRIRSTLTSLSQLDKALKLTGAAKGLSDVSAAAKKVDLSSVSNGLHSVSAGFVALSTVAVTALATITHAAITSGGQMVKGLSLDPVLDGFKEYEQNIGSIQTILANTRADGTGLKEVNAALDQLNTYSDKTIYNFGQMARNIGTFTAAGVDLQTSVASIKGISNLAAISGSSAEQASTAMYQLSQAVSTGTLRLQDWNSVVNAGMGGEVFQKALFNTGVAMHTITDAPVGTTFEEWTAKGNSFRDSLQDGWLTGEVLTNTLKGFTGELTEAQLLNIGYTKEQAAEIIELGKSGVEAATRIRTLSQLINTVKETIGSGWSQTFRTIFGNFEEASDLFTRVNNNIRDFVNSNADARNELLAGWKELGGRDVLIRGLSDAFKALRDIIRPIKDAFHDIFPPTTSKRLFEITQSFADFTKSLRPSETTINNIKRIFTGLFSALDVGWEIIKAGVGFIKDLVVQFTGLGSGRILEFAADISDFFTRLRDGLDEGKAIPEFFDNLSDSLQGPIQYAKDLKDAIFGLFDNFNSDQLDEVGKAAGRVQERFGPLAALFGRITDLGEPLGRFFSRVGEILDQVGEVIGDWFQELGEKLADAMGPGDFDAVLDALNVSLLGGITLLISKWLKGGINFNLGGGIFDKVTETLDEVTGVLKAMQTEIKADALLKIAAALSLLTISVIALSLVDSAALTKALTAMAVGFGQLVATFAIINKIDAGILGGSAFAAISAGMILLSTAILILSGAVAVLGNMSWGDLVKGLTAVTVLLGVLTASAIILSKNSGSILTASVGLIAMSTAVSILAGAVALFATMQWDTLVKGFAGVAAGLLIMALGMRLMPPNMLLTGAGLILVATGLNILAGAVALFATMEWDTLIKGFAGIAAGLLIIAGAMQLMPANMILTAAGLVVVGVALNIIALALKQFGSMSWTELGKGLLALAASLLILAVATNAMTGALAGAAAMLVVSAALAILSRVLIELSKVKFGDLAKAIGAIALALTVFGLAALLLEPVVPALLLLGVAMLALGAAFALFGVGALAVAQAFKLLGEAGPEASEALLAALEALGKALPTILRGFAEGVIDVIGVFVDAAPVIADALGVLLEHIITTITGLLPAIGDLILALIETILKIISEAAPDIIQAGVDLILNLLQGIRDNIYQITDLVLEIITEFLTAIADNITQVEAAGTQILVNFILGIANHISKVTEAVGTVITTFITAVTNQANRIVTAGANAIISFATGMVNNAVKVVNAITSLITTLINTAANNAGRIITAGANAIINFAQGIANNVGKMIKAGVSIVLSFLQGVANSAVKIARGAADVVINFLNALADAIRDKAPELRQAGLNIAGAIVDGITGGLASKVGDVADSALGMAQGALGTVTNFFGISSPSKVFMEIGGFLAQGMAIGMDKDTSAERSSQGLAQRTTDAFKSSLAKSISTVEAMPEFNPVITPVIDLTKVQQDAKAISGIIGEGPNLTPNTSIRQANVIATTNDPGSTSTTSDTVGPTTITFEQTINAPTQLSTSDIYKQTRNQITLAKEELKVA